MKKYIPLLMLAIVILALNISEENQLHNKLLISGIAVERGENELMRFTLSVMEGGEEDNLMFVCKTAEGDELGAAINEIAKSEGKTPILNVCRYLILSEELNKSQADSLIAAFVDDRTVTPKLAVFKCASGTTEYIKENQLETEKILALPEQLQTLPQVINSGSVINTLYVDGDILRAA